MKDLFERIHTEEHRNVLGRPKKWQAVDFMGMSYGASVLFLAFKYRLPKWVNLMGWSMVYIHSRRFFYAPQEPREVV